MRGASERIRLAIVDDHPVARYGMQLVFSDEPGLDVTCAVGSVAELRESGRPADVTILDLYLDHGRLSVSEIASLARQCPVLVVSASARQADVLAAIRAGAVGYITKSSSGAVFVEAARTVAAGGFYVSSQLADLIHAGLDGEGQPGPDLALAPREREALSLIAQGFTQSQAASRMGVSPATIDTYIKRIRRKLGPGNKADLTRRAIELGQVAPDSALPTAQAEPSRAATSAADP
jgi:two-component system, NarL family, nitrate/nitrite response regulator NarL